MCRFCHQMLEQLKSTSRILFPNQDAAFTPAIACIDTSVSETKNSTLNRLKNKIVNNL
jgi:hypothetical protein